MADRPMLPPLPEELETLLNMVTARYEEVGNSRPDGHYHFHASHAAFEAEHAFRTALVDALRRQALDARVTEA